MLAFKTAMEVAVRKRIYGPVTFNYSIGLSTSVKIGGWPLTGSGSYTVPNGFVTLEVNKPEGIEDETCIGVLNTVPNREDGTFQPDAPEFSRYEGDGPSKRAMATMERSARSAAPVKAEPRGLFQADSVSR